MQTAAHPDGPTEQVTLPSDCTIRGIGLAKSALLAARREAASVEIDCAAVEQADVTLLQLLLGADTHFRDRNQRLSLRGVPDCVNTLVRRGGAEAQFTALRS